MSGLFGTTLGLLVVVVLEAQPAAAALLGRAGPSWSLLAFRAYAELSRRHDDPERGARLHPAWWPRRPAAAARERAAAGRRPVAERRGADASPARPRPGRPRRAAVVLDGRGRGRSPGAARRRRCPALGALRRRNPSCWRAAGRPGPPPGLRAKASATPCWCRCPAVRAMGCLEVATGSATPRPSGRTTAGWPKRSRRTSPSALQNDRLLENVRSTTPPTTRSPGCRTAAPAHPSADRALAGARAAAGADRRPRPVRRSTTPSAVPAATRCSSRSRSGWWRRHRRARRWPGSATTSSACCCPASRTSAGVAARWRRWCARPCSSRSTLAGLALDGSGASGVARQPAARPRRPAAAAPRRGGAASRQGGRAAGPGLASQPGLDRPPPAGPDRRAAPGARARRARPALPAEGRVGLGRDARERHRRRGAGALAASGRGPAARRTSSCRWPSAPG